MPENEFLEFYSHTGLEFPLKELELLALRAVPLCLERTGTEESVLPGLEKVEVSLLGDEEMARIHGEFLDDPTPTDVITFHHGEILVGAETARREAAEHGNSWMEETLLYVIHGLLHLNGHTDVSEPERSTMHQIQENILSELKS